MTFGIRYGRNGLPEPPVEIADEVEHWARQYDRHGKLRFVPVLMQGKHVIRGTWLLQLTLKTNDKRMILWQQGQIEEPLTEEIWFHVPNPHAGKPIRGAYGLREPDYQALDILQMGATGIREWLERGDTWSGRGQYRSLEEQLRKVREHNDATRQKNREEQKSANRMEQREKRRWWLKIPFLNVGIDLRGSKTDRSQSPAVTTEEKA